MSNRSIKSKPAIIKKVLLTLAVLLVLIQFYRPARNIAGKQDANAIELHYNVPPHVGALLKSSCYDCHSNNTRYPWYNNIQPVASWLSSHVNDGKRHLNFDEFNTYPVEKQKKKLKQIAETIKDGEMPLSSYTLVHRDAKLTEADKRTLLDWVDTVANAQ